MVELSEFAPVEHQMELLREKMGTLKEENERLKKTIEKIDKCLKNNMYFIHCQDIRLILDHD